MKTLLDLTQGETAVIIKVRGRGSFRKRITEMGFVKGKRVTVIKAAPLQDPIEYKILQSHVSLRRRESALIEVASDPDDIDRPGQLSDTGDTGSTFETSTVFNGIIERVKTIDVALVGNPNCGKTTLFNNASGARERVGNFSGVTVDSKIAKAKHGGYTFNITDLPGTYSMTAWSPEELFVRRHILDKAPDIVVNVVDASNLERNLYLTTQLIDMDIRVVIALNMYDEFEGKGHAIDYRSLGQLLGIPVIPTIGSKGQGITELFNRLIEVYEGRDRVVRHVHINYGTELERSINRIQEILRRDEELASRISTRYLSIKLLEKDQETYDFLTSSTFSKEIGEMARKEVHRLESNYLDDSATLVTDAKYGFIAGALKETLTLNKKADHSRSTSDLIDRILTHKWFGFPVFILFLWVMFQSTFTVGQYPQDWIDSLVGFTADGLQGLIPPGPLKDLLIDGIINGVGSVIVFLPNILILFFFISLMEDTGYMARAAFIMDKLMHRIGLHGQSFIPLIMGFGCNVPAIMTTRTLKDRNDRLLTMLINPFMSCSARLPVYILIAGAVFPDHAGNVIFGLYLTGIVLAILISLILKKIFFKSKEAPFVMELPPYRMPTMTVIFRHMWDNGQQYLRKMGGIILIAVILIWALEYFPGGSSVPPEERLQQSYISKLGKAIEPVIEPLGFDWRMGVSLITGAAAKEVVVSTMGVLFSDHSGDGEAQNLPEQLRTATYQSGPDAGKPLFTPLVSISYLIFILIYMPCIAVFATVKRESGTWKWALFLITYTTLLAWVLSFGVYQVGLLIFQ